jgi:hypothetical protein
VRYNHVLKPRFANVVAGGIFSIAIRKKPLDYDSDSSYLTPAQSRTCLWVSADPRFGEELGKVPGTNPSSRFSGQPEERGHLEATTVRAFLVSAGFPTAGVTEEAHLHCRKCGRVLPPIKGRQSRIEA